MPRDGRLETNKWGRRGHAHCAVSRGPLRISTAGGMGEHPRLVVTIAVVLFEHDSDPSFLLGYTLCSFITLMSLPANLVCDKTSRSTCH